MLPMIDCQSNMDRAGSSTVLPQKRIVTVTPKSYTFVRPLRLKF